MESESLSMMTMNEMRTLMETLSAIYTDVCLLSADDVNDVHEGTYTASSEGKCYACGHKRHFSVTARPNRPCHRGKACRIEVCGADVLHITVLPYKVEGRSYVLELVPGARRAGHAGRGQPANASCAKSPATTPSSTATR